MLKSVVKSFQNRKADIYLLRCFEKHTNIHLTEFPGNSTIALLICLLRHSKVAYHFMGGPSFLLIWGASHRIYSYAFPCLYTNHLEVSAHTICRSVFARRDFCRMKMSRDWTRDYGSTSSALPRKSFTTSQMLFVHHSGFLRHKCFLLISLPMSQDQLRGSFGNVENISIYSTFSTNYRRDRESGRNFRNSCAVICKPVWWDGAVNSSFPTNTHSMDATC